MQYRTRLIIESRLLCEIEEKQLLNALQDHADQNQSDFQKIRRLKCSLNKALLSARENCSVVARMENSFYWVRWSPNIGIEVIDLMATDEILDF